MKNVEIKICRTKKGVQYIRIFGGRHESRLASCPTEKTPGK